MGGKTKQAPRTKNNAKPSSSSRTAELLGSSTPIFVGFSAQSDGGGLVPFAPGFASAEQMPESFDAAISPQTQIVLRKLSKKDPMTKKKALQELLELIEQSEVDGLKSILPLWPKYYLNLASDPEHTVRELTQTVLQQLMGKCKKAMAPYLKLLVPVWLGSRFDTYAPAASIASQSFGETFAGSANRTREVCLHCQVEILEYATRNLTFHTAATLSIGKSLTPEEAEQKYQRVVISSLKLLSFFLEQTAQTEDLSQVKEGLTTLVTHQKFWSLAKHKVPPIKAAWFECIYHVLQSVALLEVISSQKTQLITICFQFIDDSDPVVAPHIWGCVLLLQNNYDDWFVPINVRKALLPKLSSLLRNGFNRNAQAICPNLLPFLSKITPASLQDLDVYEFYQRFFDDLKAAVTEKFDPPLAKSDCSVMHNAYFECLRFLLQQINNKKDREAREDEFAMNMLRTNILEPISWLLKSDSAHVKNFFQHSSALVAFWDRQINNKLDNGGLYRKLLNEFWTRIFELVTQDLAAEEVNEQLLSHVLLLVQDLHMANPSLESPSVKFVEQDPCEKLEKSEPTTPVKKAQEQAAFIQKELKQLVVKLVRICLDKASTKGGSSCRYIEQVRTLTKMFTDVEFYKSLTERGELRASLDKFVALLGQLKDEACESVVEILFEILPLLEPEERFEYIQKKLLMLPQHRVQNLLLHRLLSYPLCTEPAVRQMLSGPDTCSVIARIAAEVVVDNDREKLNLLHKCFFQTDSGDILINAQTVDNILLAMSGPLEQPVAEDMVEVCGSFIAQIMPVICTNANSSLGVRQQVFLKLFRFSLEHQPEDYLSEDTLWEITTCWQDALSSKDIEIDDEMLRTCGGIVEDLAKTMEVNAYNLDGMAEAMAKFVTCSTENIEDEEKRADRIDETIAALLSSPLKTAEKVKNFENHVVLLESLAGTVSAGIEFASGSLEPSEIYPLIQRSTINLATLNKLVFKFPSPQPPNDPEDELTEDYCDPNADVLKKWSEPLIAELMQCIRVAGAAKSWLEVSDLPTATEEQALILVDKVHDFMSNTSELVGIIQQRLRQDAVAEPTVIGCRLLGYLIYQYVDFDESAPILLHEDLSESLVDKGALKTYVMALQYLLPELSKRSIGLSAAIMRTEPPEIWIKAAVFRALILNNFEAEINEQSDRNIIVSAVQFLTAIGERQATQKDLLHYNVELSKQPYESVLNTVEYIKLLTEVLKRFPYELSIKNWDAIRIGLSSWVLTVSKSVAQFTDPKTCLFLVAVNQLFAALIQFIRSEKQKSSTELLKNVIDEWDSLFAREVNVVLFKSYYQLTHEASVEPGFQACYEAILERLAPTLELLDYSFVYAFCKSNSKISLDHLCNFLFKQLYSRQHSVRLGAVYALRQLTAHFVADDIELNERQSESLDAAATITKWHFLNRFEDYLTRYDALIRKYLEEFTFKLSELEDLEPIDRHDALSYLFLWDCIINACAKSPVALRSVYTNWLNDNKYEENFLHFLFRGMPVDILKNHGAKVHSNGVYKELTWTQMKDPKLPLDRYVCHLYTEVLRKLPAVVRRWWNTTPSRQKNFVDNLTTNYVSSLICTEELKAIANRKEKHENMQVTVHSSTREVLAVYAIDEARMELVITLAPNYPLGAVKVECGKQIGGRASSRNVGMQLTIFLTHQNGTIYDGLTMWKNNLDKKFEGVEECYVCYTVIHQDTCQLPKLTCKTCKKKFHGPCLYKWFTTSSKSTCPICRNVF